MNDQNYNPDYPVCNGGSFLDHTYLRPNDNMTNSFYYGGFGQTYQNGYYPDSRRNDVPVNQMMQNPMMGTPQPPQPQPQSQPILPFSSYPANGPVQQQTPGFNTLTESRRYDNQAANVGTNPWANPQPTPQPQFSAPVMQPMQQTPNPWSYQPQYNSYVDPNCIALYSNPSFGYDRSNGSWDNIYVNSCPIGTPNIDWSRAQAPQQPVYQPTYPQFSFNTPPTTMSWSDMALKNWGTK